MPISVIAITNDQANRILAFEESHFLDLKSIDISPARLTKCISALANASGGELFVGIDERRENGQNIRTWRGFGDQEAANGHLQVFEQLFPLGQHFSYEFLTSEIGRGILLKITINKSRDVTVASDNVIYIRRGAQSLPVTGQDAISRLRLNKGITSFENETIDVPTIVITNSVPILEFLINVVPSAEPVAWLQKQQLIRNDKPTVGGTLLFAEEPQAILPKHSGVKIYRYRTSNPMGDRETLAFDPITIEGHLYVQIHNAVEKTRDLVEGIQKLGPRGLELVTYPPETLHEIVTNALLHRDYSIPVDVHIRIFDNRIEVESPGSLAGHVTPENILQEQFARNGALVRIINKFPNPPNKDVGEGLNTAFAAMSRLRLKPPVIEERDNNVLVIIRHEALASPEEAVMEYLSTHEEIVNRIGREITGIASENSMKNVFYRLRNRGLIEPVTGKTGFSSAWKKVG